MTACLSVCIVVRNGATDLEKTLASLDRQLEWLTLLPTEVVVVDGKSTDGSTNIAQTWAADCPLTVRLLSQPPRGIYAAMNEAWLQARGEWLLFINAGDLLLDAEPLAGALASARTAGQNSIQFGAAMFIPGASRGLWIPGHPPACHQSLVYRRDLHRHFGPYDEQLGICADRLFDQRIRSHGRLLRPVLLAATQVSPANASRDPDRLAQDIRRVSALGLAFQPIARPWLTLPVLRLERALGVSVSVWLRLSVQFLLGKARRVNLG